MTSAEVNNPNTLQSIIKLLRWDKPAGRLILMIPALWAIFLAGEGKPPVSLVFIVILGSLATSAAGCVVNDLWDRNIDDKVERTKKTSPRFSGVICKDRYCCFYYFPWLCGRISFFP